MSRQGKARRDSRRQIGEVGAAWAAGMIVLAMGGAGSFVFDHPSGRAEAVAATLDTAGRNRIIEIEAGACANYDAARDRC